MNETNQTNLAYQFKEASEGDGTAAIALQNLVLGKTNRTLDLWEWKHKSNPYLKDLALLAFCQGHEGPVGCYSVVGHSLIFLGRPTLAGQSTDTMVLPEFRRQGMLASLVRETISVSKKKGVELLFGFPNAKALGANLRDVKATPVGYLQHYAVRLDGSTNTDRHFFARALRSIVNRLHRAFLFSSFAWETIWLRMLLGRNISIEEQADVPSQCDELWQNYCRSHVLMFLKDRQYFSWRYDGNPQISQRYFMATRNGKLVGLSVLAKLRNQAYICELMVKDEKSVLIGKALVSAMVRRALQWGCPKVIFQGTDHGYFAQVFNRLKREPDNDSFFVIKILSDNQALKQCAENIETWCITTGDHDETY